MLEDKELRAKFEAQGNTVRIESSAQFKKTIHDNRVKWAEVAKSANIGID